MNGFLVNIKKLVSYINNISYFGIFYFEKKFFTFNSLFYN